MAKLIKLLVTTCSDCPYCTHDSDYGMSYDSGYDCEDSDRRIIDDGDLSMTDKILIPKWCKLMEIDEVTYLRNQKLKKIKERWKITAKESQI